MIDKKEGEAGNLPRKQTETCRQSLTPFISPVNTPLPLFKRIRLYPELAAASLRTHQDKPFALWAELRSLDSPGNSKIPLSQARSLLIPKSYNRKTFYRILNEGKNVFWVLSERKGEPTIRLFGLRHVCEILQVSHLSPRPREIAFEGFRGSRQRKKALIYASFIKSEGNKKNAPISRQSITEATGLGKTTQIALEKKAKIKKKATYVFQRNRQGALVPIMQLRRTFSKDLWLRKQAGNIFESPIPQGRRGMIRKINRALRGLVETGSRPAMRKRWFHSPQVLEGVQVQEEHYLWLKREKVWCRQF